MSLQRIISFGSSVVEPERIGEEFDGAETNENSRTFGAHGLVIFPPLSSRAPR